MTDIAFYERRSLGDRLAIGLTALLMALWLGWWVQPGDHDRGPGCKSQDGQPGLVQLAHPATPDSFNFCFPNTIMHGEFRVIPPR